MNNNIKRKDWVGGSAAVFKTLGASNHTDADLSSKARPDALYSVLSPPFVFG